VRIVPPVAARDGAEATSLRVEVYGLAELPLCLNAVRHNSVKGVHMYRFRMAFLLPRRAAVAPHVWDMTDMTVTWVG
jgi:hypothetical protein